MSLHKSNEMKKNKKSTWITLALFIYVTASVIYLLPKNEEMSSVEKIVTAVISYLLIVGLWFFLRKKEKMQKEREDDLNKNNK